MKVSERSSRFIAPLMVIVLLCIPIFSVGAQVSSQNTERMVSNIPLNREYIEMNHVVFIGRIKDLEHYYDPARGNITVMTLHRAFCLQFIMQGNRSAFAMVRYHNWGMFIYTDRYQIIGHIGEHFICAYFRMLQQD